MSVTFTPDGWWDYLYWVENDGKVLAVGNHLIEDVRQAPFSGLGSPSP